MCGPVRLGPFFHRSTSVNLNLALAEDDVWLSRFPALVRGTGVDVRNLKERSRSSQIILPTTSQALSVLPRTEVPFERKRPWPNWRCTNSDLSAENNNSLR